MNKKHQRIKDSGTRRDFGTGSVRDAAGGKGRFDLISPLALLRLALHSDDGIQKYGERNWELGQPLKVYFDSAVRHLYKWLAGWEDEDHLAAAFWNIQCALHTEMMIKAGKLPKKLDDLPRDTKEAWEMFLEESQRNRV